MAVLSNSKLGPPPLATPITGDTGDQFGVPLQNRTDAPLASGNLNVGWAAWFNAEFQYTILSPRMVSTTQANLTKLANYLTAADAAVAANFDQTVGPVSLGSAPFLVLVTDYGHVLQWTGTAWQWGPGEQGSGMMVLFDVDPIGVGWHLYDGTVGVHYLKSDGTLGTITLPDLTSVVGNAAFTVAGSPNSPVNSAAAPGISGSTASATTGITLPTNTGTPSSTTTFTQGTGATVTVASPTHTHTEGSITDPGHVHGVGTLAVDATGKPQNIVRRPWFRQ